MATRATPQFEDVLADALRLSPPEKARLVERVASTLESELTARATAEAPPTQGATPQHWGNRVIAVLNALDLSAWEAEDIDDPVEWVKRQRREQDTRRTQYWNTQE